MRNILLSCTAAAALLATTAMASAQQVDITYVGLDPSYGSAFVQLSGGNAGSRTEAAGVILLTTTSNSIIPVFCVDVFHTINLGGYNPPLSYTFAPLAYDSSTTVGGGNALPSGVPEEIQALANLGSNCYKSAPADTDPIVAVQGAIWLLEYGGAVTSTDPGINALIAADVTWAQAHPADRRLCALSCRARRAGLRGDPGLRTRHSPSPRPGR